MKICLAVCVIIASAAASVRADVEVLWGVTGVGGAAASLYAINPTTGAVVGTLPTGLTGLSGICVQPGTGDLFATDSQQGAGTRNLYRVNKLTGAATAVGVLGAAPGFAIADTAFRSNGTLYAWRPQSNLLYTVNLTTAVPTQLAGAPSTVGSSGITFGADGTFYMVRDNSLVTLNPAFGNVLTGPFLLSGATTSVDNLFATNAAGTLYVGKRNDKVAPTTLYTITGAGVTTLAATISSVALSGMDFGLAPAPTCQPTRKTVRTRAATATLRGKATSPLFLSVAYKARKANVVGGRWTLKVPVKEGRNVIRVKCSDRMGQSVTARIVAIRS